MPPVNMTYNQQITQALAKLAAAWQVEAVGRSAPRSITQRNGHRFIRAGKWYVIRTGKRVLATAAQSRQLNKAGANLTTYGSIGPIARSPHQP